MKLSDLIDGLEILRLYFDNPNGYHVGAEHDQFYVFATNKPVSASDVARLAELGWFQPDCGWNGPESYDPAEGWSVYT